MLAKIEYPYNGWVGGLSPLLRVKCLTVPPKQLKKDSYQMINYRLGLRIGTNSIGWCVLALAENNAPINMLDWGVRVFHDGREPSKLGAPGEPLAIRRTKMRSMRRGNERLKMRKKNILRQLVKFGFIKEGENFQNENIRKLNKLELRNNAVIKKLETYEISVAFFCLQQNRGFKSNRKDNQSAVNELKGMKLGISNLKTVLNNKTLGQFLYERNIKNDISRKFRPEINEKGNILYNFYPSRDMVEAEFNKIWEVQKIYYPDLFVENAYKAIHKAIFYQRPLKPQPKGKCTLVPMDTRMDWAMPSAQRFRIVKEINNLDYTAPHNMRGIKLDQAQRKKLYNELCLKNSLTFKQINKLLGLSSEYEFNLNTNGREKLEGDRIASLMSDDKRFGAIWHKLNLTEQDDIIIKLQDDNIDDETLENWLVTTYKIDKEHSYKIINTALPIGCSNFGNVVISQILPKMINEGMLEHQAIAACGWKTQIDNVKELYTSLPYYGKVLGKHITKVGMSSDPMVKEFGRVSNPTLHIAFNQLRRLMNKLKDKYNCFPQEIIIQVDRNLKKGTKEIIKVNKEIYKNSKKNEKWRNEIERYKGSEATSEDYLKMKLWEELAEDPMHRKCVYSGNTINMSTLFSEEVKIDYILPYSRTLDNTSANLVLITTQGAYIKRNQTPYEAFSDQCEEYGYKKILERSYNLPKSKQWRFRADAMDIFNNKAKTIELKANIDGEIETVDTGLDPFAIRPLCDTDYVAKLTKKYLSYACRKGEKGVTATPGTLTGLLRSSWGLNDLLHKNYSDHRQKIVDAFVISLTTYFTVRRVAEAALLAEKKGTKITKIIGNSNPYMAFDWEYIQKQLEIVPSYKPDHGTNAQLHDETFYGYVGKGKKKDNIEIVVRVPFSSLIEIDARTKKIKNYIDSIRDNFLKKELKTFLGENIDKEAGIQALRDFPKTNIINDKPNLWKNIRSVRVLDEKPNNILITKKTSTKTIAQGGSNHRAEIYCPQSGDNAGRWQMEIIKTFDANQSDFIPAWRLEFPDAELIFALHINDILVYETNKGIEIRRVKKMSGALNISLVPVNVVKESSNEFTWAASAKQLQLKNARQILVEIDGSIYDPAGLLTTKSKNLVQAA